MGHLHGSFDQIRACLADHNETVERGLATLKNLQPHYP